MRVPDPMSLPPSSQRKWFLLGGAAVTGVLILLIVLAFRAPLLLDDFDEFQHVRGLPSLWRCFGADCYGLFRPVKNLLFWLALHGPLSPVLAAHGLATLLLLAAGVMLYLWLRRWYPTPLLPLAGVALWSLAPTMVAAITWFSCANILACAASLLGALLLWDRARRRLAGGRRRQGAAALLACGGLYALAFCAYEAAIAFPALVVLQDLAQRRRLWQRSAVVGYAVIGGWTLGLLALRWSVCAGATPSNPGFAPLSNARLTGAAAFFLMDHVTLWLWPFGRQEILGTYVAGITAMPLQLAAAWLALLLCAGLAAIRLRRSPRAASGALWVLAALLPTSNFLPLRTGPFADYYLVLPSIGLVFLILEALRHAAERPASVPRALPVLLAALLLWRGGAAAAAVQWAGNWREPARLYAVSLRARAQPYRARANLARLLNLNQAAGAAEPLARQALAEAPWYTMACNVLGDSLNLQGRHTEARAGLQAALARGAADDYTHQALAYTCETWLADPTAARAHYRQILDQYPHSPLREEAYGNLGRLLGMQGDGTGAIQLLERGVSEFPSSRLLHHNLAVAYHAAGQTAQANAHLQIARRLPPARSKTSAVPARNQ